MENQVTIERIHEGICRVFKFVDGDFVACGKPAAVRIEDNRPPTVKIVMCEECYPKSMAKHPNYKPLEELP